MIHIFDACRDHTTILLYKYIPHPCTVADTSLLGLATRSTAHALSALEGEATTICALGAYSRVLANHVQIVRARDYAPPLDLW